jgi:hypothetical protein
MAGQADPWRLFVEHAGDRDAGAGISERGRVVLVALSGAYLLLVLKPMPAAATLGRGGPLRMAGDGDSTSGTGYQAG